ncbi:MAG: hypothetical protein EOP34_11610, partial [Rickettsiales bacterium]
MKILLLITSLIILSTLGMAQNDARDKQFLRSVFGNSETIVYSESVVSKLLSKKMRTFLDLDTIRNYNYDPDPSNYLIFTATDKSEIILQLDKMSEFKWRKNIFKHSKRLPVAQAYQFLSARLMGEWDVFYKNYGKHLYQFSK